MWEPKSAPKRGSSPNWRAGKLGFAPNFGILPQISELLPQSHGPAPSRSRSNLPRFSDQVLCSTSFCKPSSKNLPPTGFAYHRRHESGVLSMSRRVRDACDSTPNYCNSVLMDFVRKELIYRCIWYILQGFMRTFYVHFQIFIGDLGHTRRWLCHKHYGFAHRRSIWGVRGGGGARAPHLWQSLTFTLWRCMERNELKKNAFALHLGENSYTPGFGLRQYASPNATQNVLSYICIHCQGI